MNYKCVTLKMIIPPIFLSLLVQEYLLFHVLLTIKLIEPCYYVQILPAVLQNTPQLSARSQPRPAETDTTSLADVSRGQGGPAGLGHQPALSGATFR